MRTSHLSTLLIAIVDEPLGSGQICDSPLSGRRGFGPVRFEKPGG